MTAKILDGAKIRDAMFGELKDEVAILSSAGIRPGLAAVLVGNDPASQLYVKSKIAACEQLGMGSGLITPAASATTAEMLAIVEDLNRDNDTDGILIQLPLPAQVDTKRILEAVDPAKDVDGFHPVNLGRLVSGRPGLVACTPAGCMEILRRNEIAIEGANAVVLGRSDIVGKPMALLLMHANATVTICHSKTKNLAEVVRGADIVVAAMGKAGFVQADWIRPGAAVIDVGTNRVTDAAEAESGGGDNTGAGGRRADDDNDADEQYGEGGADASGESDSADDIRWRAVWRGCAVKTNNEAIRPYRRHCQRQERRCGNAARDGIPCD